MGRLYINAIPFYLRDLSSCGFGWAECRILELILHGC